MEPTQHGNALRIAVEGGDSVVVANNGHINESRLPCPFAFTSPFGGADGYRPTTTDQQRRSDQLILDVVDCGRKHGANERSLAVGGISHQIFVYLCSFYCVCGFALVSRGGARLAPSSPTYARVVDYLTRLLSIKEEHLVRSRPPYVRTYTR